MRDLAWCWCALVILIPLTIALEAGVIYRECRQHYKFSAAFCAAAVIHREHGIEP